MNLKKEAHKLTTVPSRGYRRTFVFFLLLFFHGQLVAQFYSAGVDPAGVHWYHVKDDKIQIIFQEGYEHQALTLLGYLKEVKKEAVQTLPAKIPSISVVLHNQTAEANGFVTWAPKRMELFTLADQNTYPQEWLRQLAIHEFRHVVQISTMRQGLTKVLSLLLGEQAIGGVLGLYIPAWFLEGDAVSFETAYSQTGRGRLPAFFMPYIAMLDKYGTFCYEKAVLGSYRHFIPDHYVLGYHLVSYTRYYYGERVWQTALNRVARRPYSITPFSSGIKKWTGLSKFKWYPWIAREIEDFYASSLIPVNRLAAPFSKALDTIDFISYRYPHYIDDSTLIVEKSGLSYVKEWVKLSKNGNETHVLYPGFYSLANTSYQKGELFYTEYRFDKRWTNRLWSDVKRIEVDGGKKKALTKRFYAASPSVSPSGKIAFVNQSKQNKFDLVVQDFLTEEYQTFPSLDNQMLFTPTWENDSLLIVIGMDHQKGKHFLRLNLNDGTWESLTPPLFFDINQPACWRNYILYRGAYEETEQIYAFDLHTQKHYQVTREPYIAADPSVRDSLLVFVSYTANGYQLKEQVLDPLSWTVLVYNTTTHWDNDITASMSLQEQKVKLAKDTLSSSIQWSRYRRATHLFNFHSWAPLYIDIDNALVASGASVFSQNLLSTSVLTAGYAYNNTEQSGKYVMNYQYTGLYPVLAFSTSIGDRFMKRYGHWREFIFNAGISLPFNLTHGPFTENLSLSVLPQWQSIYDVQKDNSGGLINQDLLSLTYRIDYSRLFRLAPRDLRSKWGQSFFIEYRHAPVSDFSQAAFWAGAFSVWLPSFMKHHSTLVKLQGHWYERGGYYLSSPITFPRGFYYQFAPELYRGSIDYAFPIAYPDWRISPLVYIKRFKLNLFYDAAVAYFEGGQEQFLDSKGIDFRMDCHLANFLAPIDLGLRVYFLNVDKYPNYQFLFAYQLNR